MVVHSLLESQGVEEEQVRGSLFRANCVSVVSNWGDPRLHAGDQSSLSTKGRAEEGRKSELSWQ